MQDNVERSTDAQNTAEAAVSTLQISQQELQVADTAQIGANRSLSNSGAEIATLRRSMQAMQQENAKLQQQLHDALSRAVDAEVPLLLFVLFSFDSIFKFPLFRSVLKMMFWSVFTLVSNFLPRNRLNALQPWKFTYKCALIS